MTNEEKAKLRFVSTAQGTTIIGDICDECIENDAQHAVFRQKPLWCPFKKTDKCINNKPYYFFQQKNDKSIVVFSQFRIPFDMPKSGVEIIKIFKNDLIKAIKNLQPFENCILQAKYGTTEKKTFYDVENVLFYNIGTAHFKPFAKQGVTFSAVEDKEIINLRKKYNIPNEYTHYYEYQIIKNRDQKEFSTLLAEWRDIPLNCLGLKPANCWNVIRTAEQKIQAYNTIDCDKGDTFAVVLNIEVPKGVRFNIMTAMKPLLDGLICAFHSSQFNKEEVEYFAEKLNCDKKILTKNSINVLGERESKYLQIYRNNVKWNPADDLCNFVTISIREGSEWAVGGKVYSTVKCPRCGKAKLSKLLWGMPAFDKQMIQDIESGKIKLAGCLVDQIKPRYYCRWCKKEF